MTDQLFINQQEDIDYKLTARRKDGSLLPLTTTGTKVYVIIYDGTGQIVAKFKSGLSASGWYLIDSSDFLNSNIKFSLLSTITKTLAPGKYYHELTVRYPSGTHSDDNYYDVVEQDYSFSIAPSRVKTLTLP